MKWDNPAPQTILRVNFFILCSMIKCNDYKSAGVSLFTSTIIRNSLFWVQLQQSYIIDFPSLEVHFLFMGLPGHVTATTVRCMSTVLRGRFTCQWCSCWKHSLLQPAPAGGPRLPTAATAPGLNYTPADPLHWYRRQGAVSRGAAKGGQPPLAPRCRKGMAE